jgi:phosphoribosylaminoimidazole carboxylase (NCAIR synthetase)
MINFNINRIDVKKTKLTAAVEFTTDSASDESAFLDLLLASVLAGSSANCIKQIAKDHLSKEVVDFDKVHELQNKFDALLYEMHEAVNKDLLEVPTDKHIFH